MESIDREQLEKEIQEWVNWLKFPDIREEILALEVDYEIRKRLLFKRLDKGV